MTRDAVIVATARTPIGRAYRGAFNHTPAPTLAAHALRAAVQSRWCLACGDRRLFARLRDAAGLAAHHRPHGGIARGVPGGSAGHDARPAVRLRSHGHRHRREAGDRRSHGHRDRRRRRIHFDGADAGVAHRAGPRATRDAARRAHADDRHRRGRGRALRHFTRTLRCVCVVIAAAHARPRRLRAVSPKRSCPCAPP